MPSSGEQGTVLVVDDSQDTREVLRRHLEGAGYRVLAAPQVAAAVEILEREEVELVITDIRMPGASGLELVQHVHENHQGLQVLVITGHPDVEGAVAAMKGGAADYLTKPFTEEDLLDSVRRGFRRVGVRLSLAASEPSWLERHGLLGRSEAMRQLCVQVERASRSRATVLVTGESGTGKELVARAVHYESERAAASFVPVHCGAIPEELLESELFGHVKGAYTGATEARAGFFMTADGGTVFLDEVAETSPAMQVKLLRVLQEGEVRMVGSSQSRRVDVRVIAAANRNIPELVRNGAFREDLYFRLNVLDIRVPPLRDRGEDVVLLAQRLVARFAKEERREEPRLTPQVLDVFRRHAWPGNVRELENVLRRLMVMVDREVIDVPDLPEIMRYSVSTQPVSLQQSLAEMEVDYIHRVLEEAGGNKTQAARILGIDRATLRQKLRRSTEPRDVAD